jgi:hypothetical protein
MRFDFQLYYYVTCRNIGLSRKVIKKPGTGRNSAYLLVTSACKDYPLSVCHSLFDEYLLPNFFFHSFASLALFTP